MAEPLDGDGDGDDCGDDDEASVGGDDEDDAGGDDYDKPPWDNAVFTKHRVSVRAQFLVERKYSPSYLDGGMHYA